MVFARLNIWITRLSGSHSTRVSACDNVSAPKARIGSEPDDIDLDQSGLEEREGFDQGFGSVWTVGLDNRDGALPNGPKPNLAERAIEVTQASQGGLLLDQLREVFGRAIVESARLKRSDNEELHLRSPG
jgi:hypothetical protein